MGIKTGISWCHHTFNGWWGCQRWSPGCEHCYAEAFAHRLGHDIWGPPSTTGRRFFGDSHWNQPLKWNRAAELAGERRRVFAMSMADWAEDHPELAPWRDRLFELIRRTPWLDWLMLTKRFENVERMLPSDWGAGYPNVWMGFTAENQARLDLALEHLLPIPARVRWLSLEPQLEFLQVLNRHHQSELRAKLHWVVTGGESDSDRGFNLEWAKVTKAECRVTGMAWHFKQTGKVLARELGYHDRKGGDPTEWPTWLRVQEFPAIAEAA